MNLRRNARRTSATFTGLAVGALVAASAAYAADLNTDASLSASSSLPTVVSAGDNSFTINVTATGNVPADKSGAVKVATRYYMATNGAITASSASADQTTLDFTTGYNYSQCPVAAPAKGCSTNPFVVNAVLNVAPGTPAGTSGKLTVGNTGSNGIGADSTPDVGYVQVAVSNQAPSQPGAPTLDSGSTSPNNTGNFTVTWTGSTDPDAGDTVTYTLQKRDADDAVWSTVATDIAGTSYTFTGEAEGSWRYQVQAVDDHGAASAFAVDASPIAVVDKSAPNAPTASTSPASPAFSGDGKQWFKDSVTVSFTANGDPALADTSAGSGVASVTSSATFSATGDYSVTGVATDNATNSSTGTKVDVSVDADAPSVTVLDCPTTVLLHATQDVNWTASDIGSGLATPRAVRRPWTPPRSARAPSRSPRRATTSVT